MDKKTETVIDEKIEKEVEKKIHQKIYQETLSSARRFQEEFKNQIVVAVTAAFAFLIALSWRVPIEEGINNLITYFGLTGSALWIKFFSAILITLIAVLLLMVISRWKSEGK